MTALLADIRGALRALAAARGFTAVAVLTLGAGLALSVGVLTIVNAYIVQGLPYPAADRLFRVVYAAPAQPTPRGLDQLDWSALDDVIEKRIAWDLDMFYLLGGDYTESLPGTWVTPDYMDGFGIRVAIGRVFHAADFEPGSPSVALISHEVWQTRFGGDAGAVGRTFKAYVSDRSEEPESFTIVGVLPPDLWHLNSYTSVMSPLKEPTYPYNVRLREAVPPTAAADRMTALVRGGVSLPPDWAVGLVSTQDSYTAAMRPVLWAVSVAAGLVLLIAGANVAVLMLVRGRRRQRDVGIRLALGASHWHVARMLAVEGLMIGAAATAVALALSSAVLSQVGPLLERVFDRRVPGGLTAFELTPGLVVVASGLGVLITIALTLVPLAATRRAGVLSAVGSGRTLTDGPRPGRARAVLIGVEVAASLTLLAGAALMAESAVRMLRVDFGVDAGGVETVSLALRESTFSDQASRAAFFERLAARLESVRGVTAIAIGDWWLRSDQRPRRVSTGEAESAAAAVNASAVSGNFFATVGMSLRAGRTFGPQDMPGGDPVAIVSESLARAFWPLGAVGQRLVIEEDADRDAPAIAVRIVGVVSDIRQSHTDVELGDVYLPLAQQPGRFSYLFIRAPESPAWEPALRSTVALVDPEVAIGSPRRLDAALEQERARPRFLAGLLSAVALFACALALIGMYGVITYAVRQRQREIAVRIAIGADVSRVTAMFLRQGALVLAAGLLAGGAGAVALGRVLQSQLHGVSPAEPRVLLLAMAAFGLCGLAAIWWPARRAAATDPMLALKEE